VSIGKEVIFTNGPLPVLPRVNWDRHADGRIRETLLILHQSWFFEGDVRHTLEEQEAESESSLPLQCSIARPLGGATSHAIECSDER
jgi:hypothetical protein